MIEALEAMAKDNQSIPARAMILSRKYRTLVSSWIEPLQEEAELGFEIDYIARCVHYMLAYDYERTILLITLQCVNALSYCLNRSHKSNK